MKAAQKAWLDGVLVEWEDANVHILTHALNHGTGVFEGIRCYETAGGPAIFRLQDHVDRLLRSARILFMELPFSAGDLSEALVSLIHANAFRHCYIRMLAYRAYGEMGINLESSPVAVAAAAWEQPPSFPPDVRSRGLRTTISSWRRPEANTIPPQAKIIGGYVTPSIARAEAARKGFDEAIMLSPEGRIAEASIANLFVVSRGVLATPPITDAVLPGITRDTVIRLAADLGLDAAERSLSRWDLYGADEIFLTGTGMEIIGVADVDGRDLGPPGPVTRRLAQRYEQVVRGEDDRYGDWLHRC